MPVAFASHFYRVTKTDAAAPDFSASLNSIFAVTPAEKRQASLSDGTVLRLERLEDLPGDLIAGDITKVESENFPSEVHSDGLRKLNSENPLGYAVAFAFRKSDGTLAMQHNLHVCGPARFRAYLRKNHDKYRFDFEVIVREDSWSRFDEGEVTKFKLRIASPGSFAALDGDGSALTESLNKMGEAYSAPYITIELSVGNRNGSLMDSIKKAAHKLLNRHDIEWMKAKVIGTPEELDLSGSILVEKTSIDLFDADPNKSYTTRRDAVLGALAAVK